MSNNIEPFRIAATDAQLDDLKRRLRETRWPERECVDDWSQGLPLAYAQEVATYWLEKYDWRAREARLNRFAQFKTTIDGLGIHFVHVRSPHADALPLVMTHGWPGSIVEFQKVIEPLTNPTAHRRRCGRRVSRRLPVAAGLRLLGQTGAQRLERPAHRERMGGADAAARLQAIRRARRRLGLDGDDLHRNSGPRQLRRHPSEHADCAARSGDDERSHREGEIGDRRHAALQ